MDVTGTFKHKKMDLVREGIDAPDPVWVRRDGVYEPLTPQLRAALDQGSLRL
jgi:sRNA-binding carbon storage regulator CsrA